MIFPHRTIAGIAGRKSYAKIRYSASVLVYTRLRLHVLGHPHFNLCAFGGGPSATDPVPIIVGTGTVPVVAGLSPQSEGSTISGLGPLRLNSFNCDGCASNVPIVYGGGQFQ